MDTSLASKPTPRLLRRLLALAAAPATLALLLAVPAGAPARVAAPHRSAATTRTCSAASKSKARRSHHSVKRACAKHHSHKSHPAHKPSKPAKAVATTLELVPAACEDGSAPSRSGSGPYTCEDGSTPACEEGTLVHAAATVAPMCAVKPGSGASSQCAREDEGSGCSTIEFACEDPSEGEASKDCARGSEDEAEAPEPEEE